MSAIDQEHTRSDVMTTPDIYPRLAYLDERALPRRVQGGIRHVLRLLGPALAHANRPDLRRWQIEEMGKGFISALQSGG